MRYFACAFITPLNVQLSRRSYIESYLSVAHKSLNTQFMTMFFPLPFLSSLFYCNFLSISFVRVSFEFIRSFVVYLPSLFDQKVAK